MRPIPTGDISRAARGAAAITQQIDNDGEAGALHYLALYACGFAGGGRLDAERFLHLGGHGPDNAFIAWLHRRVPDTRDVDGWLVTAHEADRTLAVRDGIRVAVGGNLFDPSRPVGEAATLPVPALAAGTMPGFVARHGRLSLDRSAAASPLRIYLSIKPTSADWALGSLARRFDDAGQPFRMKVLANPRAYARRDACVIYVPAETEASATRLVVEALDAVGFAPVRRSSPRLTGRLAPGVAIADEPSDVSAGGQSHGQWVAGLFQQAALQSPDPRAIAHHVRAAIVDAGRDPSRPYRRGDHAVSEAAIDRRYEVDGDRNMAPSSTSSAGARRVTA